MPKIIAFIDGSLYSESVLVHAAWVANRIGASVDVVHVIGCRDINSAPVDLSGNLEMGGMAHCWPTWPRMTARVPSWPRNAAG